MIFWKTFGKLQKTSDAPIWNLADIPITDNGSEISADTDSRSDTQLLFKISTFQHIISHFYGQLSHKKCKNLITNLHFVILPIADTNMANILIANVIIGTTLQKT